MMSKFGFLYCIYVINVCLVPFYFISLVPVTYLCTDLWYYIDRLWAWFLYCIYIMSLILVPYSENELGSCTVFVYWAWLMYCIYVMWQKDGWFALHSAQFFLLLTVQIYLDFTILYSIFCMLLLCFFISSLRITFHYNYNIIFPLAPGVKNSNPIPEHCYCKKITWTIKQTMAFSNLKLSH